MIEKLRLIQQIIHFFNDRARPDKACMLTLSNAHENDVNVINWNANEPFIASGGDEGHLKIWDLRNLDKGQVNQLKFHPD